MRKGGVEISPGDYEAFRATVRDFKLVPEFSLANGAYPSDMAMDFFPNASGFWGKPGCRATYVCI